MRCVICGLEVRKRRGPGPAPKTCSEEHRRELAARQKAASRAAARLAGTLNETRTGRSDPVKLAAVEHDLDEGHDLDEVARRRGMSANTVRVIARSMDDGDGEGPPLPPEAEEALEDFGYFRRRYFGRVATPWQTEAGLHLVALLATPEKEFVVLNAPPGSGKSTLFCHDFLAWLGCRDRSIRALIGSRTFRQATMYTARLRRSFSRLSPPPVSSDDIFRGLAVEPESCLVRDFGRFKPLGREDMWTSDAFVLRQSGRSEVAEKEASFAAYGMDTGFLGGRFDVVVWDDLVDTKVLRTAEGRANLFKLYEDEMETRPEPGGLLVLQGQRMAANDLYRHALDMRAGYLDLEDDPDSDDRPAKYHHIVYRAHDEGRCRQAETHRVDSPAWPDGCLLDPKRLPWRELSTVAANRAEKYSVLYQQEDVDPASVLVPRLWIDGGLDPDTGELHPGCWDKSRGLAEIPPEMPRPWISVATADPSPSKFWAVAWWLYCPASETRMLLDLMRAPMDAPEFLDYDHDRGAFTGLMETWQQRSVALGAPISHWIVEANAAQKFLLQYDHVRRWQQLRRATIVSHTTVSHNKDSDDFGIQTIKTHYRFGRVRLPGKHVVDGGSLPGRAASMHLVNEVTRWPDGHTTDDCVMAHWFLEWNLPRLFPKTPTAQQPARRPSWTGSSRTRLSV